MPWISNHKHKIKEKINRKFPILLQSCRPRTGGNFQHWVQVFITKRRCVLYNEFWSHYNDVIMTTMASQITSLTVVYSTIYSDTDQRRHQSSASLAFVWGIHRDRWIPRTKVQLRGKCFHLMTSSCLTHVLIVCQGQLLMALPKMGQQNHVHAITFLPLEGSFSNLAQIFTTKRCVIFNDFNLDPYLQGDLLMTFHIRQRIMSTQ